MNAVFQAVSPMYYQSAAAFYDAPPSICYVNQYSVPSTFIAPLPWFMPSHFEAVNTIHQAWYLLVNEHPYARYVADEDCSQEKMAAKISIEVYSEKVYDDRHEYSRQVAASSQSPRPTPMERVAKWIVRNDIENTEIDIEEGRQTEAMMNRAFRATMMTYSMDPLINNLPYFPNETTYTPYEDPMMVYRFDDAFFA